MRVAQIQNCRSALRSRAYGFLSCGKSNCCRKHRSSAASSALGLRAAEMGQTRKQTTPVPTGTGSPGVLFRVEGCGFFGFPAPKVDGSYLFGWTLDFLHSYRTLLHGFCLKSKLKYH